MGILTPEWANGAILWRGLDDAIIGFGTQFNRPVVIYSYQKILEHFVQEFSDNCVVPGSAHHDCDHMLEAEEWIAFNVEGGWLGEQTPIVMHEKVVRDND